MVRSRVVGALLLLSLFAFAACDNPTDVGGGLIDDEGFGPRRIEVPLEVDTARYVPETGTTIPGEIDRARFLAGRQLASAPLGDVEATGYIDLSRQSAPSSLSNLSLDGVEVRFVANYAYGDTTEASVLALHDLTSEWEANDAPADTTFDAGFVEPQPITTFSVQSGDTVSVVLPDEWVAEHTSELQTVDDSVFARRFHGFQVRHEDGEGVIGFGSDAVTMTARYEPQGSDTLTASYGIGQQLTTVQSTGGGARDEDRLLLQEGTGRALEFSVPAADSLEDIAINRAQFVFEVDPAFASGGGAFRRPALQRLDFYDATGEEPGPIQGFPQFVFQEEENRFVNEFPLRTSVDSLLGGNENFGRFQMRPGQEIVQTNIGSLVSVPVPSLSSALIRLDPGHRPRLVLVYTRTDE